MDGSRRRLAALVAGWLLSLATLLAAPYLNIIDHPDRFQVRTTIWLALLFVVVAYALRLSGHEHARHVWALACSAYVLHVIMAFQHMHHWSHREAFRHVETSSGFGEGIFVTYLFTLIWIIDAAWWEIAPGSHVRRPRWLRWSIDGFMLFVLINGAIIFEPGPVRWISLGALLLLLPLTRCACAKPRAGSFVSHA